MRKQYITVDNSHQLLYTVFCKGGILENEFDH